VLTDYVLIELSIRWEQKLTKKDVELLLAHLCERAPLLAARAKRLNDLAGTAILDGLQASGWDRSRLPKYRSSLQQYLVTHCFTLFTTRTRLSYLQPYDAPIFKVVQDGDIEGKKLLLSAEPVLAYAMDPFNLGLLFVSISCRCYRSILSLPFLICGILLRKVSRNGRVLPDDQTPPRKRLPVRLIGQRWKVSLPFP